MDALTTGEYNVHVDKAIERCMDGIVDDESNIIVDVLTEQKAFEMPV